MLGHILLMERKGRKADVGPERVYGLTLLCSEVPIPAGAREGTVRRRVERSARLLERAGVRRVLAPEGFVWWEALRASGLLPVDPAPLCASLASRLALAALERRGVPPGKAVVSLRGGRVSRPFFQAAEELAGAVRGVAVSSPNGGEALSAHLRQEYGVPALEEGPGAEADLTLEFSPSSAAGGVETLILHGRPDLKGLGIYHREGDWPPGFEPLPLAAALWETGGLSLNDLFCV
ncbi:conserved hypothetical protein [uncultured Eubacteriales bacterium]|uniref:Uncharacterized protein n=1 Tax=uncultured Eubacteriales bacterium TaxID=172733 RepID=A0A212K5D0_9FIRM|nr:conserved hypothetical protein [uncultured Eubacteriales bacterium]